jgi:hypothetical protein
VATETTATTSTETEGRRFGFWLLMVGVVVMLADADDPVAAQRAAERGPAGSL